MNIIGFALFFLAGLGFGYAAPRFLKFAPLIFPLLLALGAILKDGMSGEILVRLALALGITFAGIFLGMAIDARSQRREAAAA